MLEFFAEIFFLFGELLYTAYHFDHNNPAAQRVTMGCGLILLLLFGTAVAYFWLNSAVSGNVP